MLIARFVIRFCICKYAAEKNLLRDKSKYYDLIIISYLIPSFQYQRDFFDSFYLTLPVGCDLNFAFAVK